MQYTRRVQYSSIWHHEFIYKDMFGKTWALLLGEVSTTHSSLCIELQVPDTFQNMTSTNKLTPHSKCPKCIIWCINNVYILITRKKNQNNRNRVGITRYKDAINCNWLIWNDLIRQNTDLRNWRIFLWLINGVGIVDSHPQSVENTDKHTDIDGEITVCLGTEAQWIVSSIKRLQWTVQHTSLGLNLYIEHSSI